MSPSVAPPPSTPPRRRRALPLLSRDPETRAVQIGVAGTLLIHLIFFLLAPRFFENGRPAGPIRPHARSKQFNIRVVPPPPKPPAPTPPPMKYVEANPNAPANKPDETKNFSFMNQQVAQEKPTPNHKSDMPAMEGRKDFQSNQIVTGQLSKPEPVAPPEPAAPPTPPSAATPRREQTPLSGSDKEEGKNPNGFGTNLAKPSDNAQAVPNKVEGAKDAPPDETAAATTPKIDPHHPKPRPTLQQHVRPAIFAENQFGTSNLGVTALDARWNNYGEYLHRMTEIIQVQWDRILDASRIYPPSGSMVTVKFRIDSQGRIVEIVEHKGTTTDQGTNACISAITNPAPYGPWTEDMIAVLGHEQELTFTFYYE